MGTEIIHYFPHIFLLIISACLFEYACHSFWLKRYFEYGIPYFYFKIKIKQDNFVFPIEKLEKEFKGLIDILGGFPLIPAIALKTIGTNQCAFRERLWFPSFYLPIMHSLMTYDQEGDNVKIIGMFNYVPILLFLIVLPFFIKGFIYGGIFLVFFNFFIQCMRYLYICIRCKFIFNGV